MLTRLTVRDVLSQFASIRRMAEPAKRSVRNWKVRVPRNREPPVLETVYDAKTVGDTVYLCPVDAEGEALMKILATTDDRKLEAMTMEDLQRELAASDADKVVIGWPNGRHSCVCRILAMSQEDDVTVTTFLFPGPMDIEKVNEEIAEFRRTHLCPAPETDCERCGRLSGCEILEEAEYAVKARRERKTTDDNAEADD